MPRSDFLFEPAAPDGHAAAAGVERRLAVVLEDDPLGVERFGDSAALISTKRIAIRARSIHTLSRRCNRLAIHR